MASGGKRDKFSMWGTWGCGRWVFYIQNYCLFSVIYYLRYVSLYSLHFHLPPWRHIFIIISWLFSCFQLRTNCYRDSGFCPQAQSVQRRISLHRGTPFYALGLAWLGTFPILGCVQSNRMLCHHLLNQARWIFAAWKAERISFSNTE